MLMPMFSPASLPVPILTYGGNYVSASNASTYTSGSISIGDATGRRSVFVATRTTANVTTVKVGGSGGTGLTQIFDDSATTGVQFWGGLVATGTSATIYTSGGSSSRISLGVWHAQNVLDPTTPVDTASYPSSADSTRSATIDVSEGGFIIISGITYTNVGDITFSDVTDDFNESIGESTQYAHGGSLDEIAAVTGRTLAFTVSGGASTVVSAISMR